MTTDTNIQLPSVDDVPRSLVREVLEQRATQKQQCPVCNGEITTTNSMPHNRECTQCGTRFMVDGRTDDGEPEYAVDMQTTPLHRIRKGIRDGATFEAVEAVLTSD
jgi:ribosomal protein L37AE/L43A